MLARYIKIKLNVRCMDDVFLLNTGDSIYPIELQIKHTTDEARTASYRDIHLEIDSEERFRTIIYDKRDEFC